MTTAENGVQEQAKIKQNVERMSMGDCFETKRDSVDSRNEMFSDFSQQ